MKTFEFGISVFIRQENEEDAVEELIEELDNLFGADNNLIAYTHPQEPISIKEQE